MAAGNGQGQDNSLMNKRVVHRYFFHSLNEAGKSGVY